MNPASFPSVRGWECTLHPAQRFQRYSFQHHLFCSILTCFEMHLESAQKWCPRYPHKSRNPKTQLICGLFLLMHCIIEVSSRFGYELLRKRRLVVHGYAFVVSSSPLPPVDILPVAFPPSVAPPPVLLHTPYAPRLYHLCWWHLMVQVRYCFSSLFTCPPSHRLPLPALVLHIGESCFSLHMAGVP